MKTTYAGCAPIPWEPSPPPRTQSPNKVHNTYLRPKTCFTYLGWSYCVVMISKKQVLETSIFELPRVKNCMSRLCAVPFIHISHSLVETVILCRWHESGPRNTFRLKIKKTKRFKRGGGHFFDIFDPHPPTPPSKKWVSSGGGGLGVIDGCVYGTK